MKKIVTLVISLIMIFSMSSVAFAAAPADGTYSISVSLTGSSHGLSVQSCSLNVSGGQMTATVVLSSSSYTYLQVGGVQYFNTNDNGNSTFNIPVSALDTPIPVSGETTAMSDPHVVNYTFTFSSQGVKFNDDNAAASNPAPDTNTPAPADSNASASGNTGFVTGNAAGSNTNTPVAGDTSSNGNNADSADTKLSAAASKEAATEEKTTEEVSSVSLLKNVGATEEGTTVEATTQSAKSESGNIPVLPVFAGVVLVAAAAGAFAYFKNKNGDDSKIDE